MSEPMGDDKLREMLSNACASIPNVNPYDIILCVDEIDRLRAELAKTKEAISKAKVDDWLLNWFGENSPEIGEETQEFGYTYAQIADCTNYICKHLDAALAQREGKESM